MNHAPEQTGSARLAEAARHETVLDVSTQRVARVYAEALLGAAGKRYQTDEFLEELEELVQQVFGTDPQFESFLSSSAIGRHQKEEVIRKVFENRGSELLVNALLVLNDHERLGLLRAIVAAYRDLRDDRSNRIRVAVESAVPLPEDQRQRLLQELRETFLKEPVLNVDVDPDLLGGMVVRVGDWLYDHSVRAELDSIRNQMIASSTHEIQSRRDRFSTADGN